MSATDEVVSHLRGLRSSCAEGMAWSSALVWGEKTVLLSNSIDDVLWMANALVTNGQYRQAEELLVNPKYAKQVRASHNGRYLACVVAMRLGRAEAALDLLNTTVHSTNDMAQTPTAKHSKAEIPVTLFADQPTASPSVNTSDAETCVPLDQRSWMLYMQGACAIQLSNMGATDETPSIKRMQQQGAGSDTRQGMDALVTRMWTQALHVDARCWEAWTGLREYGLLTAEEETELVRSVDWTSCCRSEAVARFFRDYCLATQTSISQTSEDMSTVSATHRLLTSFPQLINDPSLRTLQAARLLAHGHARSSLSYTVQVLEHRHVPDPSATSIHITALTMLRSKEALFRVAHELAEEFGLSAVKRAEVEAHDTGVHVGSGTRGVVMGATGTGRLRTGARGLLVPETPTRSTAPVFGAHSVQRGAGAASSAAVAHMVGQTASVASSAVWRGLWGLPTWTQPGPPLLATYPCALGPASSVPVSSESVLNTFTTGTAQAASGPQYEFMGASLAWYAIGCYYLVSAELAIRPDVASREWAQSTFACADGPNGLDSAHMRNTPHVSPEASHMIDEARRWLAKTTMASPRSVVAWTAFAHTFIVSGEWESATRALHTAVSLCGCERAVHNAPEQYSSTMTPSKMQKPDVGRGSRLAHVPLASLGSVYLQLGDLSMAESCLHASALNLTGLTPLKWALLWRPTLDTVDNTDCIEWCKTHNVDSEPTNRLQVLADAHLINDVGMLYYSTNDLVNARAMFMLALIALHHQFGQHHVLHTVFNPRARSNTQLSPELRAYNAVVLTNLGNTLRRLNCVDGALVCLREAQQHAPRDTNITLSIAYALHMRAIDEWDTHAHMLDEAVDVYHRVLADRPGDPVATDLLTLALELSMRSVHIDSTDDEFALRSLDEIGLLSLQPIGSPSNASSDEDSDEAMDIEEDSD
ncbi:anaphase-promoting complex subunit Cut9 [Coemansia sp. RSA 1972]|nr:anaphase-promoting complex subunit Cut9 [Coemansia sp. RSA 1972]